MTPCNYGTDHSEMKLEKVDYNMGDKLVIEAGILKPSESEVKAITDFYNLDENWNF